MAKADSVHSTPPTNTSAIDAPKSTGNPHTRRSVLGAIAAATAAVTVAGARPAGASPTVDPIYALIAEKRAADVAHGKAIDAQDEVEERGDLSSDAAIEVQDNSEAACDLVNEVDWKLATTLPATLAGVAAVLRFANQN